MVSNEQKREINKKILKVTSVFINTGFSIEEVSKITGIPRSSVQRYLNDKKRIVSLLGEEVYEEIQKMLSLNKQEALKLGGYNSVRNNIALRDENGKFIGNIKK